MAFDIGPQNTRSQDESQQTQVDLRGGAAMLQSPMAVARQWRGVIHHKPLKRTPRDAADKIWHTSVSWLAMHQPRMGGLHRTLKCVLALEKSTKDLGDAALSDKLADFRESFRRRRETREMASEAIAAVREQARRRTGLQAYPNQILAADALYRQYIAEVATGEGKSLIAAIASVLLGWRGAGCHVVTVNDYLARRDAERWTEFFKSCGLTTAWVDGDMLPPDRRRGYAADVTYLTNKEACADFLRDQLALRGRKRLGDLLLEDYLGGRSAMGQLVMRGLPVAIVDEVDSILLDEAATPLIISGDAPNDESVEAFTTAATLAPQFTLDDDYTVNQRYREVRLTSRGRQRAAELCGHIDGVFASPRRREELLAQALTARHLFLRDEQYIVHDGKIVIIDESTGRQMPDRTWRDGLHQAVEAKEQVEVNPPKATFARVSFQRFFRGYRHLCGMSGTTWEGRHEFQLIYERPTVRIPTNKPVIRKHQGLRAYRKSDARWNAVADEVQRLHAAALPVLVGTTSVDASELLSRLLQQRQIPHAVLNAVRHEEEAQIVAMAGQRSAVTIATNMAGRGTDILLGAGVETLGGLHVIAATVQASARLDRQLFGRAGRQGQPGVTVMFVALEDELARRYLPAWARRLAVTLTREGPAGGLLRRLMKMAQQRADRMAFGNRKQVLRQDEWLEDNVGFAPGGY